MKRKIRVLLMFVLVVLFIGSINLSADEAVIDKVDGASIRTATAEVSQGLRFYGKLNQSMANNEHGFYLVYGKASVEDLNNTLKIAVTANTDLIYFNDKEIFKVVVLGVNENNQFSVVLTGIPTVGYLDNISVFAYVKVGNEIKFADPITRSVGEVALRLDEEAQNHPEIKNILNSLDSLPKKIIVFVGEGVQEESIISNQLTSVKLPTAVREGYDFLGWKADKDQNPFLGGSSQSFNENKVLKAEWKLKEFTISYNLNGGTGSFGQQIKQYDKDVNLDNNQPTKTGHTFLNWKKANGSETYSPGSVYQVNENIELVAQWQVNQYTITFNSDGGSAVAAMTQDFGSAVVAPANPTKAGYTFNGWSPALPATMPASNNTHKALWTIDSGEYTIAFVTNGGIIEASTSGGYQSKAELATDFLTDFYAFVKPTDTLQTFMHGSGKTSGFDGTWYNNQEYQLKLYAINVKKDNDNYFLSSSAYQAKWEPFCDFMIDFVAVNPTQSFWDSASTGRMRIWQYLRGVKPASSWPDEIMNAIPEGLGGSTSSIPSKYQSDSADITLPIPTRSGYSFVGWYENSTFTGSAVTKIVKGSTGNKTFYAKWEAPNSYTITYELNGGTLPSGAPSSYNDNSNDVALVNPTRSGYEFKGWYDNANFTGSAVTKVVKGSTGNKKFYAKWEVPSSSYTITFELNGGKFTSYDNVSQLAAAFLTDFYAFVNPTDNLQTFMHGSGKTSGFDGTWYSNETYRAKLYAANIKTGNNNYFLSSAEYQEKWAPFVDFMEDFLAVNPEHIGLFWNSPYTGQMRIKQYFTGVKPSGSWSNDDMNAIPEGLASVPSSYQVDSEDIDLPIPIRSGYIFAEWYTSPEFTGLAASKIPKGSTGNKTFYAKWAEVEISDEIVLPVGTFVFSLRYTTVYGCVLGAGAPTTTTTEYNWSSSDPKIVRISEYSTITPVSPGFVIITAVYKNDSSKKGYLLVKVEGATVREATVEEANQKIYYTVTFLDDSNNIIDTQEVLKGMNAKLPTPPTKAGKLFFGWDSTHVNIQQNKTIKATYIAGNKSFEGKKVTIIGDSTSTYYGYMPSGFSYFYPYPTSGVGDVNQMWWMQVINKLGMSLLVNNSYSGTTLKSLSGNQNAGEMDKRLAHSHVGAEKPDYIFIFMGLNDISAGVTAANYKAAYNNMISKLKVSYPNAEIILCTITTGPFTAGRDAAGYNKAVKEVAAANNFAVLDFEAAINVNNYNGLICDSVHPSLEGMNRLAAQAISDFLNFHGITKP